MRSVRTNSRVPASFDEPTGGDDTRARPPRERTRADKIHRFLRSKCPILRAARGYGDLSNVPVPGDDPLVRRQIAGPHRPARVELVGADPDLRPESVLAAVRKARGRVDDDAGGVD